MSDEINPTTHCPYPKHRGMRWDLVVVEDREYAEWLVGGEGPEMDEGMYDAIMEALEDA